MKFPSIAEELHKAHMLSAHLRRALGAVNIAQRDNSKLVYTAFELDALIITIETLLSRLGLLTRRGTRELASEAERQPGSSAAETSGLASCPPGGEGPDLPERSPDKPTEEAGPFSGDPASSPGSVIHQEETDG